MEDRVPPPASAPVVEHKHWVEQLGQKALDRSDGPYTITGGMTTSGPAHMGTLCEMLYPQALLRYLKRLGKPARYLFVADILDAFDSVPMAMQAHAEILNPHLGKPLCDVPDPTGKYPSFGEHFLQEGFAIGRQFGIEPELVRAQELYASGAMDEYARLFIARLPDVRRVVATTSLKDALPADWSPLMPICEKCGRIATTRATLFWSAGRAATLGLEGQATPFEADGYDYACDKDVKYAKGCGHSGSNRLSDHRYKLTWRLHWPAWMRHFKTSVEGAGMDHHTRGGSWDTCQAVFREIFRLEPPVGYQFGFVLFQGKKYSKSKGIGMGLSDLIRLQPPPVLAYALLRPDLTENRDINPTAENLLRLLAEYEEAGRLAAHMGLLSAHGPAAVPAAEVVHQSQAPAAEVSRAERKRALAFALASDRPLWQVGFNDLLIHASLYGNWDVVAQKLGHPDDIAYLAPYVQAWQQGGLVPEDYRFVFQPKAAHDALVAAWAQSLRPEMGALEIHNSVFTLARERGAKPGELFEKIYADLIGKPRGPKLGRLVEIVGVQKVKDALLGKN